MTTYLNGKNFNIWSRSPWISNSISKGIMEGLLYASSSAHLWSEIKVRYGEANDPQIY